MANIKPDTPEAILAATLPGMEEPGEKGEQCYQHEPPDPGATIMFKRADAIASLIAADGKKPRH